jgi:hypothetical protein
MVSHLLCLSYLSIQTGGATPVFIASMFGHARVVEELLRFGGAVDSSVVSACARLRAVCTLSNARVPSPATVFVLVVDCAGLGTHALVCCSWQGHFAEVAMLLKHGAAVNHASVRAQCTRTVSTVLSFEPVVEAVGMKVCACTGHWCIPPVPCDAGRSCGRCQHT